jgi:NAD-dependent histone deacetylase SIR2
MLQDLNKRKTLLRCYSQNIDGLESKVGFVMDPSFNLSNKCIPLHGSLHFLQCTACKSTNLFQDYYLDLASGHFPLCQLCQQKQDERSAAGHRHRKPGQLRPHIILYGEEHPHGIDIGHACRCDSSLDFLLVVGTSLKVPGTAHLIKEFSRKLHSNQLENSIYINKTPPSTRWQNTFDVFIEGDCQIFAKSLRQSLVSSPPPISHLKSIKEEDSMILEDYLRNIEERQDFSPSWRWL